MKPQTSSISNCPSSLILNMELNKKIVIPFLTLIFLFTMNMDFVFNILKHFEAKEASEVKKILLWNFYDLSRRLITNDDIKFPASFEKLGCPEHRCILTDKRYIF